VFTVVDRLLTRLYVEFALGRVVMNGTLSSQIFLYLVAGALLIAVSMQLGGQYDFIASVRDLTGYSETA
jgi:hypothetical protein